MPVSYDSPVNEYWNVLERHRCGMSACRNAWRSPDAEAFMQLLTPRDITTIEPGGAYVFLTNQDGGVLNDPVMLRLAEDRFWLSTADSDMYLWAKGVSAFAGHEVEITTPHVSMQLQAEVGRDHGRRLRRGDPRPSLLRWMRSSVDGIDVVISRTGYSSELGYEVYLLDDAGGELWEILMTAGKPYGISPGSPNRIRRIEGGGLDYASDITPDENPLELGPIDSSRGHRIPRQGRAREGAR